MLDDVHDNPDLLVDRLCDEFEGAFQASNGDLRLDVFWNNLPAATLAHISGNCELTRRLLVELIRIRLSIDESRGIERSKSTVLSEIPKDLSNLVELSDLSSHSTLRSGRSLFANAYRQDAQSLKPGDSFGNYRLIEHLGSGGMGTVWRARQSQPIERDVAIKLIGVGTWNRHMVERFRRECRAMALLQHPNIARLLEASSSDSGQPYLVMELVDGPSIVNFAQQHMLTIRQRIELFLPLCHAVQHAHQKGILHRDLKPSNILVASHEGMAQAKIIDLGLAKAVQPGAIESVNLSALMTTTGQVVGTLDFMSPEQTRLGELDIDTRCDVYSLGCVLYELLTGQRPFQGHQLNDLPMEDAIQVIRTAEPPKLSSHNQHLRGELEWIVRGCMEKDRSIRYETASAIADELTRWLDGEPIRRAPPSRLYLTKKFVRRHRGAVAAVTGIVAVLCIGLAATLVSLNWAIAEQVRANDASKNAEQVLNYLTQAFSRASSLKDGHKTLLVDVLRDSIEQIDKDFPEESEIKADIQYAFGDTLNGLGQFEKALPLLQSCVQTRERFLGTHPKTLAAKSAFVYAIRASYLVPEQIHKLESELVEQHQLAGTENTYDGLMARLYVAYRKPSVEEVTRLREQLVQFHGDRAGAYEAIHLAVKHFSLYGDSELLEGRIVEARQQLESAIGPAHRYSLKAATAHLTCLAERNRFREAAEIAKTIYSLAVTSLSDSDLLTNELGSTLGSVLDSGGDYDNALAAFASTKARCERVQLSNEIYFWSALEFKIAQSQLGSFRLSEAIRGFEQSIELLDKRVGTINGTDVERRHYLLEAYVYAGNREEASKLLVELQRSLLLPEWQFHNLKGNKRVIRLKILAAQAFFESITSASEDAVSQLEKLLQDAVELGEPGRRTVRRIRHYLGMVLTQLQQYDQAIVMFDAAIVNSRELDIAPWIRLNIQREKAWALFRAAQPEDAHTLLQQTIDEYSQLETFDGSIEDHPQYRLAKLCQSIMREITAESIAPSADVTIEIEKIKAMIGPESPLLLDKLAVYQGGDK